MPRAHNVRMKTKSRSENETVQINLYSGGKLWTTFEAPRAWTDRLTDYCKRAGITFDELLEQALSELLTKASTLKAQSRAPDCTRIRLSSLMTTDKG
jgi:hypothetical protein